MKERPPPEKEPNHEPSIEVRLSNLNSQIEVLDNRAKELEETGRSTYENQSEISHKKIELSNERESLRFKALEGKTIKSVEVDDTFIIITVEGGEVFSMTHAYVEGQDPFVHAYFDEYPEEEK